MLSMLLYLFVILTTAKIRTHTGIKLEKATICEQPYRKEFGDRASGQSKIFPALSVENEIFAVNRNKLITAPFFFIA